MDLQNRPPLAKLPGLGGPRNDSATFLIQSDDPTSTESTLPGLYGPTTTALWRIGIEVSFGWRRDALTGRALAAHHHSDHDLATAVA